MGQEPRQQRYRTEPDGWHVSQHVSHAYWHGGTKVAQISGVPGERLYWLLYAYGDCGEAATLKDARAAVEAARDTHGLLV